MLARMITIIDWMMSQHIFLSQMSAYTAELSASIRKYSNECCSINLI